MNWRLIPYTIADPAQNMAIDEAIFHFYRRGSVPPTLRFYGWNPPTLSVGYFQDINREVNVEKLTVKGFGLVRRPTGGRAVLHHRELTYSVIAGTNDGIPDSLVESYFYIARALVEACTFYGLSVNLHQEKLEKSLSGACFDSPSWYEITVGGKKLVGSAQLRQRGALLQHGSILLEFSAGDLGEVLNLKEDLLPGFIIKMNEKVTSFGQMGISVSPSELANQIVTGFSKLYHSQFTETTLSEPELALAQQLGIEKYGNKDWLYSRGTSGNEMRFTLDQSLNSHINREE